jgi:hypothetical protein
MKKLILLCMVLGVLAAFTAPALAGNGDLEWAATKTVSLAERFDYTEKVTFTGTGLFLFDGEAWSKVQEQQELYNNNLEVDVDAAIGVRKEANITSNSFNTASGIANVNQSPGNLNNQGNTVAFSHANNGTDAPAAANTFQGMFCEAEVVSVQYNGILFTPADVGVLGGDRTAAGNLLRFSSNNLFDKIDSSFNVFAGIANVNQAAGYLNNQGNAVALSGGIGQPGAVPQKVVKAASDVMLAQANAFNTVSDGNGPDETAFPGNNAIDSINNAFGNAFGIANANQAAGVMNNQKNNVAISFSGYSKP